MSIAEAPHALVLAPMRAELRPVVRAIGGRPDRTADVWVHVGRAGRTRVTAALIGVGPGPAGRATKRLLDAASYDVVVVSGIAGGIGPRVAVGDLVTPAEVEDLVSGRRFTPEPLGNHAPDGVLSTTAAELILDDARLREMTSRGVVALDMETAAVAEECEGRQVPWAVFRVVSDRPEEGLLDHAVFELLEADGSVNLVRTLRYVAARPGRVRGLAHLARDAAVAARRAARAAVEACASL
ncbi:MAG TPA: hypothetical protein VK428_12365 [Acidimicrobiales bacterium]|nr:hypothetical protein [Acidimicrobiales bacterium]